MRGASNVAALTLTGSVGKGGTNDPADLTALRDHLVALGYDWLAGGSGDDAGLRETINLIQSIRAGRDALRGDGRLDVPGTTYEWLRAANAPRWQLMPAGGAGQGFHNFELADTKDTHDYGTDWMAGTIRDAGVWYRDNYLASHSSAAPLTINDVSLPRGGNTPDHDGHETGLSCDCRLPRTDGNTGGVTHASTGDYDQDATRAMLQAIRHQPMVTRMLFNDADLIRGGLCKRASGHDNHFHFDVGPLAPVVDYSDAIDDLLERAITFFGGTAGVDPSTYPMTMDGFQEYLDALGVDHFSAREMLTPHHENTAKKLGYTLFLPPHRWWRRGGAHALLANELRKLVGEPVVMRNWWRPADYNAAVDGAAGSDHVFAHAVDLDYRSADSRRKAEKRLRELYNDEDWLQVSLGLGGQTTHAGLLSPGRRREWTYSSYTP
jgi:hypothetical protein